jgi:hypothetical protein
VRRALKSTLHEAGKDWLVHLTSTSYNEKSQQPCAGIPGALKIRDTPQALLQRLTGTKLAALGNQRHETISIDRLRRYNNVSRRTNGGCILLKKRSGNKWMLAVESDYSDEL